MLFIIIAILMLGILILVHETGHFLTGKWLGFKINEFSIGMGPKLISQKGKETVYSLRLIPMGGFVAFGGEDEEGEADDPRAMNNMPWYKRAIVMFSGAGFNIIFAFIMTAILTCSVGYYAPQIASVTEQSELHSVAQKDDIIYAVNGETIFSFDQLSEQITKTPNDTPIRFSVLRNGEKIEYSAKKYYNAEDNKYLVGISYGSGVVEQNIFQSFGFSFKYNVYMAKTMYKTLGQLVTGQLGTEGITGPISTIGQIGTIVEDSVSGEEMAEIPLNIRLRNMIIIIIELLVIISLNLAIMNLLPLPALDGFRLISAIIEGVTGKHLPRKTEGIINFIGLALLIGLMAVLEISKLF